MKTATAARSCSAPALNPVSGQLFIRAGGMVLRGSGQGGDAGENTIIQGIGNSPNARDLIVVAASNVPTWTAAVPGTRSNVTSDFLPAGSRTLEVAAAEFYRRGDQIIITQPSTPAWLASIDNGSTGEDAGWAPGEIDIYYNRRVTGVNIPEGKITVDAPIYDHLDRSLAQSQVYILDDQALIREIGIENLRIDIATDGPLVENHARVAIELRGVEDSWIRDVTALNFSYALVDMTVANRVTVTGCSALEPHSPVTGGRRYNFNVSSFTNNILFTDNYATEGRHSFVSNGASTSSGIVWTNSVSDRDLNTSEGHRRWSQGLLFDNIDFRESNTVALVGLYNRGDFGTGHGWASTNSVAWNVSTPPGRFIYVQKPPGRQNYAVGCSSNVNGIGRFEAPAGYIELTNQEPAIQSLYTAQLEHRRAKGVAPDAPARLRRTFLPDGSILLTWDDIASGETGYEVVVSNDGGATHTVVATLPPNANATSITAPRGPGQFIYRVYATGESCPSPFSNPLSFGTTATREARAGEVKLYPNPVSDVLMIAAERPYTGMEVFNANGVLVAQLAATRSLDVRPWPAGLYSFRFTLPGGHQLSARIIKQ